MATLLILTFIYHQLTLAARGGEDDKYLIWSPYVIYRVIEPAKATGSVISPLCVRPSVHVDFRNELISENAPTIFLKLGMKLGDNKGKK